MANTYTISNSNVKYFETSNTINYYLAQIRKYTAPTTEEEKKLFDDYHNGSKTAREQIILRNQRFVFSLAKMYARDNDEIFDYINEGNFGLIEAMDKFGVDDNGNYTYPDNKFLTFAVWYIRRQMNAYLIKGRDCIVKSNQMKLAKKIDKINRKFYNSNGRNPHISELKEILMDEYGIEVSDDSDLYDLNVTSISNEIDDDYTVENTDEFIIRTASFNTIENDVENEDNKMKVYNLLKTLPSDIKVLIMKMYGIGYDREYSLDELSCEYDIDIEYLIKIKNNAINALKDTMTAKFAI